MSDATALERAHLVIRGVRSELVVQDGAVTLTKHGSPPTRVTFSVGQVRGTSIEPASRGGRGWLHISVVGGSSAPPGELAAMSDPYTLPLTSRAAVTARRLARMVEKHVQERGLPSEPTFAASASANGRYSSGVAVRHARHPAPPLASAVALAERGSPDARTASTESGSETPPVIEPVIESDAEPDVEVVDIEPSPRPGTDVAHAPTTSPPTSPPPTVPPPRSAPSAATAEDRGGRELADQLHQLGQLRAAGVLTEAEFERAKARVLG